jgi:hypothetical protein
MYSIVGVGFCILEGFLIARFGWMALVWSSIGVIVSVFVSSSVVLPIVLGMPIASRQVSKKEMRPTVLLALLRAPLIWAVLLFLFGFIFPRAVEWIAHNETLCIGLSFGFIAILISPVSKKVRTDFRIDFDKSYGRYATDPDKIQPGFTKRKDKAQLKQIEAVIKISSNLYLNDFVEAAGDLKFQFPDSRFRCLIFSLSTVMRACADLLPSPEAVQKECLHFLSNVATSKDRSTDFFNQRITVQQAEESAAVYYQTYVEGWENYYEMVEMGDKELATTILCSMLHSLETDEQFQPADRERLGQLAWQLEFSLTNHSMREAFISLVSK